MTNQKFIFSKIGVLFFEKCTIFNWFRFNSPNDNSPNDQFTERSIHRTINSPKTQFTEMYQFTDKRFTLLTE